MVISELDPVALGVASRWGTPDPIDLHVDGAPLRRLAPGVLLLRRPGRHIFDEGLDRRFPRALQEARPALVFPSIHRSESGQRCFTVHPLGNPGSDAEVGGVSGRLTPTSPRLMADALRRLSESGRSLGLEATFEATHHGPELGWPAFFVEIGFGEDEEPPSAAVDALARVLPELSEDPTDRVALAIGGGHYAPHFTELVLERKWAVGHILSRHSLERMRPGTPGEAWKTTPGAEGILPARAADYEGTAWTGVGRRMRDQDAARR
ncbi:MAG: D-aminoacyl-tRNA deacylase [Thermoplasmata archaeon]|nr:D-aminoacyl-tRNA deacylase [Thermoplasmata archaeon]